MIQLQFGSTATVTLTLSEFVTLSSPFYYLFVFTERATNTEIKFTIPDSLDLSANKERCNQFDITPADHFERAGMYAYRVYQKQTNSTDLGENDLLLETGIMIIDPAADSIYTEHDAGNETIIHHND